MEEGTSYRFPIMKMERVLLFNFLRFHGFPPNLGIGHGSEGLSPKIPNHKFQIPNKLQIPISNTSLTLPLSPLGRGRR